MPVPCTLPVEDPLQEALFEQTRRSQLEKLCLPSKSYVVVVVFVIIEIESINTNMHLLKRIGALTQSQSTFDSSLLDEYSTPRRKIKNIRRCLGRVCCWSLQCSHISPFPQTPKLPNFNHG